MPFTSETALTGTQFQPGQSGNPKGKPKGMKHLSTYIQELMDDENFSAYILDGKKGIIEYKGAPAKAIVQVAVIKAVNGDKDSREWLAKYGYGTKLEIDDTGDKKIIIETRKVTTRNKPEPIEAEIIDADPDN